MTSHDAKRLTFPPHGIGDCRVRPKRLRAGSRAASASLPATTAMVDVARSCLNKLITGNEIWTGRFMTKRVTGADGELTKVIRLNAPHTSFGQAEKLGFAPDMSSQTANVPDHGSSRGKMRSARPLILASVFFSF